MVFAIEMCCLVRQSFMMSHHLILKDLLPDSCGMGSVAFVKQAFMTSHHLILKDLLPKQLWHEICCFCEAGIHDVTSLDLEGPAVQTAVAWDLLPLSSRHS